MLSSSAIASAGRTRSAAATFSLARILTGTDDQDPAEHARRRASVVRAARRLALPGRS
jgi:hypothetical protein